MIIGVDESGTGAWAGPFTVCALAVREEDQSTLFKLGVRDSKLLSDRFRRSLVEEIIDIGVVGCCIVVMPTEIRQKGQRQAWRDAVKESVIHVTRKVEASRIVMDGLSDQRLVAMMKLAGIRMEFLPRADATVPAVGAASIIAKTIRNDRMIELHNEYSDYGWNVNAGYGTPQHKAAIKKHGVSLYHRPIKTLIGLPARE